MALVRGELSGLTDLEAWLAEIRKVAALEGQAALDATDVLLWSVVEKAAHAGEEPDDWTSQFQADHLARLREATTRIRSMLDRPEILQGFEPDQLRQQASLLSPVGHGDEADADTVALVMEARDVADRAEVGFFGALLRRLASEPLASTAGLPKRLSLVSTATSGLQRFGALCPEYAALGRRAAELGARYRAQKKLDEAEVAAAGGNAKKAEKCRKEAAVLLAQDWARAFPGESGPP